MASWMPYPSAALVGLAMNPYGLSLRQFLRSVIRRVFAIEPIVGTVIHCILQRIKNIYYFGYVLLVTAIKQRKLQIVESERQADYQTG